MAHLRALHLVVAALVVSAAACGGSGAVDVTAEAAAAGFTLPDSAVGVDVSVSAAAAGTDGQVQASFVVEVPIDDVDDVLTGGRFNGKVYGGGPSLAVVSASDPATFAGAGTVTGSDTYTAGGVEVVRHVYVRFGGDVEAGKAQVSVWVSERD